MSQAALYALTFLGGVVATYLVRFVLEAAVAPYLRPVKDFFDRRDKKRIAHRARRRAEQHDRRHDGTGFTLVPGYVVPFERADGAGDAPIHRDNLSARLTFETVALPDYLEVKAAALRRSPVDRNGRPVTNNPRYAVRRCRTGARNGVDEDVAVSFELDYSDYVNFLVTQELDEPIEALGGATLRDHFLQGDRDDIPPFMLNSLGAHVLVVTGDDHAIFHRRSASVSVQGGRIAATASEGLSRGNDSHGQSAPDLWRLAERGLDEEVGLDRDEYSLSLLTVGIARDVNQWVLLFVASTSLGVADVQDRMVRAAKDRWELGEVVPVPFAPRDVIDFLVDQRRDVLSVVPPLAYHALVARFGRASVEAAIRALSPSG